MVNPITNFRALSPMSLYASTSNTLVNFTQMMLVEFFKVWNSVQNYIILINFICWYNLFFLLKIYCSNLEIIYLSYTTLAFFIFLLNMKLWSAIKFSFFCFFFFVFYKQTLILICQKHLFIKYFCIKYPFLKCLKHWLAELSFLGIFVFTNKLIP